jgi:crotonobetainyl-CoA:carnitine CoA-transferase CaiB-like acyl-CoA transferase
MSGVLSGVRVLQLAGIGPVPFAGMLLADLGADVIVVENPNAEPSRGADLINRRKRSVFLDLKSALGIENALKIGSKCDILIEGMRPGVAERLGLGPEQFQRINPALVYGRMTGWGQTGRLAAAAGHDLNYLALSGATWYASPAGQPPVPPPTMVGDLAGGALYLVIGALSALLRARATGRGDVIDTAIVDCSAHLSSLLLSLRAIGELSDERGVSWIDGAPWYQCYACSDDLFVSVGALEGKFFATLMRILGLEQEFPPASQFDKSGWPTMRKRLAEVFASASRQAWQEKLEGTDSCFAPVFNFAEAAHHPHNVDRGIYTEERGFLEASPAPRFARHPDLPLTRPSYQPGADTEDVLRELCS